ncbi:unnamed protein product [Schistosoma margrebowiei]|uniref:Uncharacterized protein n=1 Tax=Schistosoma margrebowiei TaxID=48269 RepID=A0A183N6Q1_9TREM|nr:unnamed protein product [Schistosoma margrebowiei]
MQMKTTSVASASESIGTNIHKRKSVIFKFNTENTNLITLDSEALEEVKSSTYIVSTVGERGGSDADV